MKIIISSLTSHYIYTAYAAETSGVLKRFITGAVPSRRWQNWFSRVLPVRLRKKLKDRADLYRMVQDQHLVSVWAPEILRSILDCLPLSQYTDLSVIVSNRVYDRLSSYHVSECDIFHYVSTQGYISAKLAKNKGAIVVVDERGAHPRYQERILQPVYEEMGLSLSIPTLSYVSERERDYELADYILVPSEFSKKSLIHEGLSPDKIIVLPYGVDIAQFRPRSREDEIFRILYVGRVVPSKGLQDLVNAYDKLALPNSELRVVGSVHPSMMNYKKAWARIVSFLEHVPQSELAREYANASVVVLPSYTEGSSLVSYEAMACGRAVIVTVNCGAVVEDGVQGFVVPPGDVDALADRIQILYQNESLRREMGEAARVHAQQFTWQRYGQRLMEIYHSILRERGRSLT